MYPVEKTNQFLMKNYLIIALSAFFLTSCSSSDDNPKVDPNPSGKTKLLRYVNSIQDGLTYNSFNSYHYQEDKLVKMYAGSIIKRFQFEYQNDKIATIAGEYYNYGTKNILTENFNYTIIFNENEHFGHGMGKVNYEGGNVIRTKNDQGAIVNFKPNGNISQIQLDTQIGSLKVWEYTYDKNNNTVTKIFGTDVYKYEFDDKTNPYFIQYKKFGFYEYGGFISPDICQSDEFLFPNNIAKIYKDGILVYSAIYQYDTDGYPIMKNSVDYTHSNPEYINDKFEFKYFNN